MRRTTIEGMMGLEFIFHRHPDNAFTAQGLSKITPNSLNKTANLLKKLVENGIILKYKLYHRNIYILNPKLRKDESITLKKHPRIRSLTHEVKF